MIAVKLGFKLGYYRNDCIQNVQVRTGRIKMNMYDKWPDFQNFKYVHTRCIKIKFKWGRFYKEISKFGYVFQ